MKMNRRDLNKLLLGVAGGILAGCEMQGSAKDDSMAAAGMASGDKHVCKGMKECKRQGGCSTGDNGCAGKNS